ncbi:MAG: AAA family ATPase [Acidobacteria bacterium]|nr:AAA family ATPase [Acidobacteriota bacterium]
MRFTHLTLENWRNFSRVDVDLQRRVFIVGPNASGKSNILDAFRFLRDIADPNGGGLQAAVARRDGLSQIRSLHARRNPHVGIEVHLDLNGAGGTWRYRLEILQDNQRVPRVHREQVWHGESLVLNRPDADDRSDPGRLTQTHLQQINANKSFRPIAEALSQIRYMHLVPQLVREPDRSVGKERDPFGGDFLEQLARTPKRTLDARLRKLGDALKVAVPQLQGLELHRDEATGVPHLRGLFKHWRPNAGWQTEGQFSDGTLRLLGLLWVLLDGTAPLLLEEPELSLHTEVVRHIPQVMARLGRRAQRQIIVSTHSAELLADPGIALEEVLLLRPTAEGTDVQTAAASEQIAALLSGGLSVAEAVLPATAPAHADQLVLIAD